MKIAAILIGMLIGGIIGLSIDNFILYPWEVRTDPQGFNYYISFDFLFMLIVSVLCGLFAGVKIETVLLRRRSEKLIQLNDNNSSSDDKIWPPAILHIPSMPDPLDSSRYGQVAICLIPLEAVLYAILGFCIRFSNQTFLIYCMLMSILPTIIFCFGAISRRSWMGILSIIISVIMLVYMWTVYAWSIISQAL